MNKNEYKELITFHPGYYIKDIIEDMEITQEDFAMRIGISGKTLSKLIHGHIDLSEDVALNLSIMLGTSIDVWLNMQATYNEKCLQIEKKKRIDEEIKLVKMLDYNFFVRLGVVESVRDYYEKVVNICSYLKISSLNVLLERDFLVNYRVGITTLEEKNIVSSKAWLQTAINYGKNIETERFDSKKLISFIPEIRNMTLQEPKVFLPRLKEIFCLCGVSFVLLPSMRNAGINGAVKWVNSEKVILAINDRRHYADTFWFSLFHEIKHVLQQKIKTVIVSSDKKMYEDLDIKLEEEADKFATDTLIPQNEYLRFVNKGSFSEMSIIQFSKHIGIHPGIVVGRLQNDRYVGYNQLHKLKQKYIIK